MSWMSINEFKRRYCKKIVPAPAKEVAEKREKPERKKKPDEDKVI